KDALRALPANCDIKDLPAQAQEATLAYIRCPSIGEDYGPEAADYLKELVWDKDVIASIHGVSDNNVAQVVLGDPEHNLDVNSELLRTGHARVPRMRHGAARN